MSTQRQGWCGDVLTYPMHGQRKLLTEGYRTRDGHVIEWIGTLTPGGASVVSRPDPVLAPPVRRHGQPGAVGTRAVRSRAPLLPDPRGRRRWWVASAQWYPKIPSDNSSTPALVWNPFLALTQDRRNPFRGGRTTVLDLLDDWTTHHAFATIRDDVHRAYRAAFDAATRVTANGEGAAELARRHGRDDVVLLPNGCDPERFDPTPRDLRGATRVGYVGKIGRRLDLDGIISTAAALPEVEFIFAGPVLDRNYRAPLAEQPNIRLLGDVHYDQVPALLRTFDVGWVPHLVGRGEVGGDVIKTYEYRAAGLPVLTTAIAGAGRRGLDGVTTVPMSRHHEVLADWTEEGPRVARVAPAIPERVTWQHKTRIMLELLGVQCAS
ncbi:glycosyltransferase [Curtobacterium sp. MCSS17_007]|uniref:glycosyltransferase n=1 Tax=Curtobacterium sp. MCSS17_007 TaxID=2175646 RepID=UPI000DA9FE16|nr:glycosyltransferase [Curtobacterium sp. MCSS17_007]WIE76075.1 glycosyltransferase [Curtobacterium sp. MCSS17_007]